ncbi:hypothetical protein Taro_045783 [Colocasia esculenta]|uniref:Uncharacterized protein n=1 Tax=Colocasia esculenta TaxID=4460 RepID=A0A843WN32_COLES|nr:hypothetical protein [Colocasia esculenta]
MTSASCSISADSRSKLMPPEASPEPVDLLSPEWCSSAIQIFQPAAPEDAGSKGSSLVKLEHAERRALQDNAGDVRAVPPLKMDDLKSWIWLQQAIHPEVDYDRCLQKRWLSQKITPWKSFSIKKWAAEMKQRRKEEGRLQKAEVHAAISVARVAAALAAVAAENAELSRSKTSKENSVAAAAALVAAQCAQAAEAVGAKREHIASTLSAAMATTDVTDILTLTAAAATSLRGAATLRGRTWCKKGAQKSMLTLPAEELDFDLGKCMDSLAKGTELPVVTPDGNCRIRLVSVYLNKNGKVILRIKKINALVPFATGKESVVHYLHSSEAKVTSPEENSSYSIIMATSQGTTKLNMKDYVCYRIWITSISQMLMLSTNHSNYELQPYGD